MKHVALPSQSSSSSLSLSYGQKTMEEDLRRDILPGAADLGEACGWELTHNALSEESGVTTYSSSSALYGHADSSLLESMNWTDDKHNLYLDSLERSFVGQLNHSSRMNVLIWEDTEAPYLSPKLSMENCASFDEDTKGVHATACRTFSCELATTSMQQSAHYICHQNPVGSTAEITDQNFVDDGKRSSAYSPMAKRVRRSSTDGSSNDQVVP